MLELGGGTSVVVLELHKRSWWPRRGPPPQVMLPGQAGPGPEAGCHHPVGLCLSGRLCIQLWELCVEAGLVPAMLTQVTGTGVTPGAWASAGPGLGVGGDVPPQPGCEAPSAFFSLASLSS